MKQNNTTELSAMSFPYFYNRDAPEIQKKTFKYVCLTFALFVLYFCLIFNGWLMVRLGSSGFKSIHHIIQIHINRPNGYAPVKYARKKAFRKFRNNCEQMRFGRLWGLGGEGHLIVKFMKESLDSSVELSCFILESYFSSSLLENPQTPSFS